MSIDFSKIIGWNDRYGALAQVADASGRVLWVLNADEDNGAMVFQAKTETANTYAGETSYSSEVFLLLDIYPKTNGTVKVTYGGLTKTITDTSGAAEPNAIQVFFGTFNGVSDEVETPATGTLTIDGDYRGVGQGSYVTNSKNTISLCECITDFDKWGNVEVIPDKAFYLAMGTLKTRKDCNFPEGLTSIGTEAFYGVGIKRIHIPSTVKNISGNPWQVNAHAESLTVANENNVFKLDENCLIEIATGRLIYAPLATGIPSYVTSIDGYAFYSNDLLTSVTIPANVESIGQSAFGACKSITDVTVLAASPPVYADTRNLSLFGDSPALTTITVPAGCGEAYKTAEKWSTYADIIVEAS